MRNIYALAVAGLLINSVPGALAQAETLIVAHGFPLTHPVAAHGILPWLSCVEKKSNGGITFNHFPAGQLTSHQAAIDSVNNGLAQVSAIVTGYVSEKFPLNGITLLPDMGTTAAEMVGAWRKTVEAGGPLADEYKANKVHPLFFNLLPAYQVMSMVGPLDTLDKFKGVKLRVGGGSTNLMAEALGAVPVDISTSDMYVAMQRHTVDATTLTLSSAKTYSMPELVNAMSTNGSFGSGGTSLVIDQATYDKMSPEHRKILDDCGLEAEGELTKSVDDTNEKLKTEFSKMGIDMYAFPDDVTAQISKAMAGVGESYVKRLNDRGLPASEAYSAYRKALGK